MEYFGLFSPRKGLIRPLCFTVAKQRGPIMGIRTLRAVQQIARLDTTFKLMVRSMFGLKRRPVVDENGVRTGSEQWLDFYKRSMSRAGTEIRTRNMGMTNLVGKEVRRWAGLYFSFPVTHGLRQQSLFWAPGAWAEDWHRAYLQ